MAKYTFVDLAHEVLQMATKPLTYQEIWDAAVEKRLSAKLGSQGKTPSQSLGAILYSEVRDNPKSRFVKVSTRPTRFFLKSRENELPSEVAIQKIEKEELESKTKETTYHERDLHPLLSYFANTNPSFNRGRAIYTKTIFHERSYKSGYNEWVHPDVVGFYIPLEDWNVDVIEFNRLSDNNSLRMFSFEIKKTLNKSNYRESFFQAVSNSSWSHEGYLVASDILKDDDFLSELERLAQSFGIGIIELDLEDIDASSILYPAKGKPTLDWEAINKLCEQNPDFLKFIQDVRIAFDSKRIYKSEFDEIRKDITKYIADKLKIKQIAN